MAASRPLRALVAVVIASASVWWLWRAGDARAVFELLRQAHTPTLVLSVCLLMTSVTAKALRWRAFLPGPETLGAIDALRIFHLSILVNNLLPFRIGDGVRVISEPVRRAATRRQAISVLIAERLVDTALLGGCALIALPAFARANTRGSPLIALPGLGSPEGRILLGGAVALLGGAWLARRLTRRRGRVVRWIASLLAETAGVMRMDRRRMATAGSLTVLAWGGTFALHYALLITLGIEGSAVLAVVVTLATNLSMLAPATPANVGVTHAAAAAPLLAWGLPADVAVAYAVLVHAVNTVPPMLVGLLWLGAGSLPGRTPATAAVTPLAASPAPPRGARRSK